MALLIVAIAVGLVGPVAFDVAAFFASKPGTRGAAGRSCAPGEPNPYRELE